MQKGSESGDRERKEVFNYSKLIVILIGETRINKESVCFK